MIEKVFLAQVIILLYIIAHFLDFVKDFQARIATSWAEPSGDGERNRGVFGDLGEKIAEKTEDDMGTFVFRGAKLVVVRDGGHGGTEIGFASDSVDRGAPLVKSGVANRGGGVGVFLVEPAEVVVGKINHTLAEIGAIRGVAH